MSHPVLNYVCCSEGNAWVLLLLNGGTCDGKHYWKNPFSYNLLCGMYDACTNYESVTERSIFVKKERGCFILEKI